MTGEAGGGGDGPANDNADLSEAANDNVDAGATEAGAGGEGPNEGGPTGGEPGVAEDPSELANDNVAPGEPVNDNSEGGGEGERERERDAADGNEDSSAEVVDRAGDGDAGSEKDDGAEARDSNEAGEQIMARLNGLVFAIGLMVSGAGGAVQDRIDLIKENLYEISVTVSVPEPGDSLIVRAVSQEEQELMSQLEDLLKQANELEQAERELELGDAEPSSRRGSPEPDQSPRRRRQQAANDNDGGGGTPNEVDE